MAVPTYTKFGLKVGNTAIPDPSTFEFTVADLDLSGERDSNGLLHRDRVATKHNVKVSYDALAYSQTATICNLLSPASFQFTFIRPDTNATYTGTYYCGDRTMGVINASDPNKSNWLMTLSFDLIEY